MSQDAYDTPYDYDHILCVIYINRASLVSPDLTAKFNAILEGIETSTHVRQHLFRKELELLQNKDA